MNKLIVVILVISLIGNAVGGLIFYKYWKGKTWLAEAQATAQSRGKVIKALDQSVAKLTGELDNYAPHRIVFLHHSVGEGMLNEGGLRDKLLDMGILVKSATYGDQIGEDTDMNHWVNKFGSRMQDIFDFSTHGDHYRSDGKTNEVVMFKSCFPNSEIEADGDLPGDPSAPQRTLANYKATWTALESELAKYPDKLFIYLTAPPVVPEVSSPDEARRARDFNTWLMTEYLPAYRQNTGLDNLYIFDLFGVLTDNQGFLKPEYRVPLPADCHPNIKGSQAAATAFMAFFTPIWEQWQKKSA